MRLVDADEILRYMEDKEISQYIDEVNKGNDKYSSTPLYDYVKTMLTTYDIDKVVEELNKAKDEIANEDYCRSINKKEKCVDRNCFRCCAEYLIEIVKHGGVSDDVCEWKSTSDGEFIQNPHTNRLYSNEPSMKNVYCNTCGKKLKIVGNCGFGSTGR